MKRVMLYRVELARESAKLYDIDTKIDSSFKAPQILRDVLSIEKWHNEKFGMLCLDNRNNLVGVHIISEGTVNEAAVYVREVAMRALLNNAAQVIIFHNHPAGSLTPSNPDKMVTNKIKTGLETLGIKLIDHIILTDTDSYSFAEKGLL
jgi:DNA repair protein RadC